MGVKLRPGDALLLVDVQADFVDGALAVPRAAETIPVLNAYIAAFERHRLPIVAMRDWHPANHPSFKAFGGPWPPHCVVNSPGAQFAAGLVVPPRLRMVSKSSMREQYSGFDDTDMHAVLSDLGVRRLFVGGLATDYCVVATVLDARKLGYEVVVLVDAVRAVDVEPGDGERALRQMLAAGALPLERAALEAAESARA